MQFLRSIKSFIKFRQQGTNVRNTINSIHLEFKHKHWVSIEAVIIHLSAKENISSAKSVLFVKKAVGHDNTGSIEISFYNDAADEINDGKCYKISNLILN